MFSAEELFVRDIKTLQALVQNPSDEAMFAAAPVFRRLLLDENPLIDQANRNARLRITFGIKAAQVDGWPQRRKPNFSYSDILPIDDKQPLEHVKRDQFLARVVFVIEGRDYTVRDIVKYICNSAGAVHKGTPKPEEQNLDSVGRALIIGGMRSPLWPMISISKVAIEACRPLYNRLTSGGA